MLLFLELSCSKQNKKSEEQSSDFLLKLEASDLTATQAEIATVASFPI